MPLSVRVPVIVTFSKPTLHYPYFSAYAINLSLIRYQTHTHTHSIFSLYPTHTYSQSLTSSLSLFHTHTHKVRVETREREREREREAWLWFLSLWIILRKKKWKFWGEWLFFKIDLEFVTSPVFRTFWEMLGPTFHYLIFLYVNINYFIKVTFS